LSDIISEKGTTYLLNDISAGTTEYAPGHLIGATLGGPNDPRNLVAQWTVINRSGGSYYQMENWIRDHLKANARMQVTVVYPTGKQGFARFIPDQFDVAVSFGPRTYSFKFIKSTTKENFLEQVAEQIKEKGEP
jgi:hypothetical protein